jgi:hypothetical protein
MARTDKAHFVVRAPAGTALTGTQNVKLNAGGSVIPSVANDALGVTCIPGTISAGRPCSVLLKGELVEFGGIAATKYYAGAGGTIGTASGGSAVPVGWTVEADRLVINM